MSKSYSTLFWGKFGEADFSSLILTKINSFQIHSEIFFRNILINSSMDFFCVKVNVISSEISHGIISENLDYIASETSPKILTETCLRLSYKIL